MLTKPTALPFFNLPLSSMPPECDVLVVGCGPAGSACAKVLAQSGLHVVMVDSKQFPRDKTCGDALVPDAHAALRQLGLLAGVLAQAQALNAARCVAPSGSFIDVPGDLAVIPRLALDALLCRAAVQGGAQMFAPAHFVAPLRSAAGRVIGATLRAGDEQRTLQARWVVLATGAGVQALVAAGMCLRRSPSSMALRAYVRHTGLAADIPGLRFIWHSRLKGGYGWIFPGPDSTYNIGVGELGASSSSSEMAKRQGRNLREMFNEFLAVEPLAARLMTQGVVLGALTGAPLRCDLQGAQWNAPGVLVAGDAVGATYAFSGEGIGKSLETGMAAAQALLGQVDWQANTQPADTAADARVLSDHTARLSVLVPQFQLYRKAGGFNRTPWLISLVIWRAKRSPRIVRALSDILAERRQPGSLFSWRGLKGMLLG
jgi:menaquinone-9 beta-reductase